MSICKIIPIGQSYGVGACKDYICDENKVLSEKNDAALPFANQTGLQSNEEGAADYDINAVLVYMKNDEKTQRVDEIKKKYISGYMCNPETAVEEFINTKKENLHNQSKTLSDETGNWAYHIIQSFPEGLDISDEEVHQCGRELCEKLALYQGVVCSHIHPVVKEKGESIYISGKCKHNHILINSHMHPDKLDPQKPGVYKYHDCKESYAQLQKWNDEISLAHGLPVIRDPDLGKQYSWFKSQQENEGTSWTKRVATDIKNTIRFCSNWEEFKKQMTEQGYYIRETGKTITYYTPEHTETHKQQIRDFRLGREYTKESLEKYWITMQKSKQAPNLDPENPSKLDFIKNLVKQYNTNLFAEVTIKNKSKTYILNVPIKNPRKQMAQKVLKTYFEPDKTYNLCTSDNIPFAEITGKDLYDYYEWLEKEKQRKEKKDESYVDSQEYYSDKTKIYYKTKKPYKIKLYDENGRRRTTIELICILAIIIIKNEHSNSIAEPKFGSFGVDGQYIYAKTDKKLQDMYDTMIMAKELHVGNEREVDKKMQRAGTEVSRKKKQFNILTEQYNDMEPIQKYIDALESVKDICEQIYSMPEGEQKEIELLNHAEEHKQYTSAKRYLHMKNIHTDEEISDFESRFNSVTKHYREVERDMHTANEEYRKLKKIKINLTYAQNNYYCYGPSHPQFQEKQKEQATKA